jgi:TIR domain
MRVFISHASQDKAAVLALAESLRALGIDPWLDTWEIGPTDDIVARINQGLHDADAGIIVIFHRLSRQPLGERRGQLSHQGAHRV